MKSLITIFILLNFSFAQKQKNNTKNELIIGTETNLNNNYPIFKYSYLQSINRFYPINITNNREITDNSDAEDINSNLSLTNAGIDANN